VHERDELPQSFPPLAGDGWLPGSILVLALQAWVLCPRESNRGAQIGVESDPAGEMIRRSVLIEYQGQTPKDWNTYYLAACWYLVIVRLVTPILSHSLAVCNSDVHEGDLPHRVLTMTTYTSAELAALAEQIPTEAGHRGLLFVGEAEFNKEADVELNAATVTVDSALAIAVTAHAPFVSLEMSRFSTHVLRSALATDDVLPEAVEDIIAQAEWHEGDVDELKLRWPAQGLIFEWTAAADWYNVFCDKLVSAQAEASLEAREELEDEWVLQSAQMKELLETLTSSSEFRFATIKRRRPVAEDIAMRKVGDAVSSSDFRRVLKNANEQIDRNVLEQERVLRPQILDLVTDLRSYPEWRRANTQVRMRDAVVNFLAGKADGYRLGTTFIDQVMQAALGPDHWQLPSD
jgi:hypothetical protein